jgi:transposase, IS5 family
MFGVICCANAVDAPSPREPTPTPRPRSRYDGAQLPNLIDKSNTAGDVWADTAYRSAKNEKHLADNGLRSQIHRKKPKGKPMPEAISRANGRKSTVRAFVEHVFA